VTVAHYEVVWPLDKRHYLSPALSESDVMSTAMASSELTPSDRRDQADDAITALNPMTASAPSTPSRPSTTGRDLAGRALLAGCSKPRTRDLLGVSSRTVGRIADADLTDALQDAEAVEQARTCLAETASRGSTPAERDAAEAWLRETMRDARQVERVRAKAISRRSATTATRHVPARRPHRNGTATPAKPKAEETPTPSGLALEQVDELQRQQRRILHRSTVIDCVLKAEGLAGPSHGAAEDTRTMGNALIELVTDVIEASRTIEAILLQFGTARPSRPATAR
jgi:hypothetical protein